MNEKIRELALESNLINYIDLETPRRYFISGNADLEEVEKFAELLLKEVLHFMDDGDIEYVASMIGREFGVKE